MNEIEKLLIDDILNDIPEETEHKFSDKYMRQRRRNIKRCAPRKALRMSFRIAVVIAVALLVFTGWNDLRFINGFAVSKTQISVQLTSELENAPKTISHTVNCSAFANCSHFTEYKTDTECWYVYVLGNNKVRLRLYTLGRYNELMGRIRFYGDSEIHPFSSGDLKGICRVNSRTEFSEISMVAEKYVIELKSNDLTADELIKIAKTMTFKEVTK